MTLDLKVGDKVRLTGKEWKFYADGVTIDSVVEVTEITGYGTVWAGDAGILYFEDTKDHQIGGFEWELVEPEIEVNVPVETAIRTTIQTLGEELGIDEGDRSTFNTIVDKLFYKTGDFLTSSDDFLKVYAEDNLRIENGVVSRDAVNPDHYKFGKAEVIEITRHLGFLEGNVVKYVTRAARKGKRLEDLKKARKYLDWAIEDAEADQ